MSLTNILNYFSLVSGFFPVLVALFYFKRLDGILKMVAVFFFISSVVDITLSVLPWITSKNNTPVIHLFLVIIIVFFGSVYYRAFSIGLLKKITIFVSALALAVIGYYMFAGNGLMEFPSVSYSFLSLILTILSLLYFYQLLNTREFIHLEKLGMFWINAGVLFYFGTNIFLFMLFDRIIQHYHVDVWVIHDFTNIIANILYAVGLFCQTQKAT